jgi:arylsulfatase A-like enzyme
MRTIREVWFALFLGLFATVASPCEGESPIHPNILLIITDDQGYGDLGLTGNPILRTPHIDQMGREGVWLRRFYAQPVCAPTRAALLTGRHAYRTGVVDTYLGRARIQPREVTLGEILRDAGYRTGIIGKWHLGDCAPSRPHDQGFAFSLVHRGGGLGQPSDEPGGRSYFNPILFRNGLPQRVAGYCTDAFTDAAIAFLRDAAQTPETPFFLYLAYNAPHTPLELPGADLALYRDAGLDDTTARVYGMIHGVDRGIGRVREALRQLELDQNTLILFLGDNGPQQSRWNAGLRGLKGQLYEGGIRVPALICWPGRISPGQVWDDPAFLVDILPTLRDAVGVSTPPVLPLDGQSLWPALSGGNMSAFPADRVGFAQWHRGDAPQPRSGCAVITRRWKLVQPVWSDQGKPRFQLYDLLADPGETRDLARSHPEILADLLARYDHWFAEVTAGGSAGAVVRIDVGSPLERTTILTRQDWRGPRAGWFADSLGHWDLHIKQAGRYDVNAGFEPASIPRTLILRLGSMNWMRTIEPGAVSARFERLPWPAGPAALQVELAANPDQPAIGVERLVIQPSER